MPLANKQIQTFVIGMFGSLGVGARRMLESLAKALRDDYTTQVQSLQSTFAPSATVTVYLDDGENYIPPPLYAGVATAVRSVYLAPATHGTVLVAGLQNVILSGPVFLVNLGPGSITVLDATNVSGLTPANARFDFSGSDFTLAAQGWMVVHYDTGSQRFVLDADGGN